MPIALYLVLRTQSWDCFKAWRVGTGRMETEYVKPGADNKGENTFKTVEKKGWNAHTKLTVFTEFMSFLGAMVKGWERKQGNEAHREIENIIVNSVVAIIWNFKIFLHQFLYYLRKTFFFKSLFNNLPVIQSMKKKVKIVPFTGDAHHDRCDHVVR